MEREDLVALWGGGNLICLPAEQLAGFNLAEGAKAVLVSLGLPRRVEPLFVTDLDYGDRLPIIQPSHQSGPWYLLGTDGETQIVIEALSGEVASLSPSGDYPDRFVNSDLASFVAFLYHVSLSRGAFIGQPERILDAENAKLEAKLLQIDRRALADANNWWPLVVEQLKDGLL